MLHIDYDKIIPIKSPSRANFKFMENKKVPNTIHFHIITPQGQISDFHTLGLNPEEQRVAAHLIESIFTSISDLSDGIQEAIALRGRPINIALNLPPNGGSSAPLFYDRNTGNLTIALSILKLETITQPHFPMSAYQRKWVTPDRMAHNIIYGIAEILSDAVFFNKNTQILQEFNTQGCFSKRAKQIGDLRKNLSRVYTAEYWQYINAMNGNEDVIRESVDVLPLPLPTPDGIQIHRNIVRLLALQMTIESISKAFSPYLRRTFQEITDFLDKFKQPDLPYTSPIRILLSGKPATEALTPLVTGLTSVGHLLALAQNGPN